jgi:hypothetical protein
MITGDKKLIITMTEVLMNVTVYNVLPSSQRMLYTVFHFITRRQF